ncbi:ROK family protein [Marinitoga sp. 38H-ov]|uniref:ROK family transcriptional regulator n=1 Tax=Marinitoga sp. 38H-ov TaxID=1755814 RepID=UPI0013E9A036|nr:ROK family protein [Marinitoga sp. 38H-ov]KAF2956137.1 hypothetical protein AS160_07145 [Marinitoga sp. 38H-ov]
MIKITDSLIKTLNYIWKKDRTYLMEISNDISLEKSTVSRTLNKLKDLDLIKKIDELSASPQGGRKTSIYGFNYSIGNVLGISIEQDGIEVILTDLKGNILKSKRKILKIDKNNIVDEIKNAYDEFKNNKIFGVGISLPGIISNGEIIYSKALNIERFPLIKELKNIPVYIENDSNCGALYFNLKDEYKNILYFHISVPYYVNEPVGTGIGIIINNKLFHGSNNYAGEVELNIPLVDSSNNTTFNDLLHNIKDYNFTRFIELYSQKIGEYISIFDPDNVLIGGNITLLGDDFLKNLIRGIKNHIFMYKNRDIYINHTSAEDFLTSRGAASLILHKLFESDKFLKTFLKRRYYE